jgi:uncharacterized protein
LGEGDPVSRDACHIPDVRHRVSVRGAQAPCDQVARRFRRLANRRRSPRGYGGTYVPEIFKILGIAADIRFGAVEQMAAQMADGKLDGVVIASGFPIPALAELDAKQPVDFVQPSSEHSSIVRNKLPEITPSLIPAGTYRSRVQEYHTFGLYNFAVAHKELPDDPIYKSVRAVFDNRDELMKAQSSAKETLPENVDRNSMLPLHPGAVRYYRELGITVPPAATVGN